MENTSVFLLVIQSEISQLYNVGENYLVENHILRCDRRNIRYRSSRCFVLVHGLYMLTSRNMAHITGTMSRFVFCGFSGLG